MNDKLKKAIIGAMVAGGIATGAIVAENRVNCDYKMDYEEKEYCITKEVKQAIESNLQPNSGFGGVRFNQK